MKENPYKCAWRTIIGLDAPLNVLGKILFFPLCILLVAFIGTMETLFAPKENE